MNGHTSQKKRMAHSILYTIRALNYMTILILCHKDYPTPSAIFAYLDIMSLFHGGLHTMFTSVS